MRLVRSLITWPGATPGPESIIATREPESYMLFLPATVSLASCEECNPDGSDNSDIVATYLPVWRCSVQSSPWSLIMSTYVCCRAPDWSSASMS